MSLVLKRHHQGLMWSSLLLALMLEFWQPSGLLAQRFWPQWLMLVMSYWILELSRCVSMLRGVLFGLVLDLGRGVVLGQHALLLVLGIYLLQQTRLRIRFYPMWQQTAALAAILLLQQSVQWALYRWLNLPAQWNDGLWTVLSSALLWPWLFLLLDRLNMMLRRSEG